MEEILLFLVAINEIVLDVRVFPFSGQDSIFFFPLRNHNEIHTKLY